MELNEIKLNTYTVQSIFKLLFAKTPEIWRWIKREITKEMKKKANIWSMKEIKWVEKGQIKLMIDAIAFHLREC